MVIAVRAAGMRAAGRSLTAWLAACRSLAAAAVQGSLQPPPMVRPGYGGGRGGGRGYDPAYAAAAAAGPYGPYAAGGRGGAGRGAYWGPEAYMGYYSPMGPGAYYAAAAATAPPAMFPRGRGGFFPGGKNWAGARPPPPGQPGFSSGLQVRRVAAAPWGARREQRAGSSCGSCSCSFTAAAARACWEQLGACGCAAGRRRQAVLRRWQLVVF